MSTDFLYPFIERDEHDAAALLADLAASAAGKAAESSRLRTETLEAAGTGIAAAAAMSVPTASRVSVRSRPLSAAFPAADAARSARSAAGSCSSPSMNG